MFILTGLMTLLTAIPGVGAIITGVSSAFFNAKVRLYAAKTGTTTEVAKAALSTMAVASHESTEQWKTIAGSKALLFLVVGFAMPYIIFEWWAVVHDKIFCPQWYGHTCNTDPITGQIADWASIIIPSLFGAGTGLTVAHIAGRTIDRVWGKDEG